MAAAIVPALGPPADGLRHRRPTPRGVMPGERGGAAARAPAAPPRHVQDLSTPALSADVAAAEVEVPADGPGRCPPRAWPARDLHARPPPVPQRRNVAFMRGQLSVQRRDSTLAPVATEHIYGIKEVLAPVPK